jgi:hypothetical protein
MELANNYGLGFNRDLMLVSFVNYLYFKYGFLQSLLFLSIVLLKTRYLHVYFLTNLDSIFTFQYKELLFYSNIIFSKIE